MTTTLDQAVARVCTARPGPLKSAAVRRLLYEIRMQLDPSARPEPRIHMIGLTGDPRSGKDTVGHMLAAARGYVPVAFADALRREVLKAWHATDVTLLTDGALKGVRMLRWAIDQCSATSFVHSMARAGHNIELPRSPREVMQLWGEWRRAQNPGYWVERLDNTVKLAAAGGSRLFAVCDVRRINELEYVRAYGECWRVVRPEAVAFRTDHISCTELLEVAMDREVHNDGDLQHLASEVGRVLDLHDAGVLA